MNKLAIIEFILILLPALLSCTDSHENLGQQNVKVNIYESAIPTHGLKNQDVEITLKAQGPNGCYSNLKFSLAETDSKHFLLSATALFRSNGVCPEVIVYKDTVIHFRPTSAGEYSFQVNEEPFEIRHYEVEIN
jgi:hypothetical protein